MISKEQNGAENHLWWCRVPDRRQCYACRCAVMTLNTSVVDICRQYERTVTNKEG